MFFIKISVNMKTKKKIYVILFYSTSYILKATLITNSYC